MIPVRSDVRVWLASGYTDMRKGMGGLARLIQEGLGRDPFAGDVFVFRGRSGTLIKALWHDGVGLSLYAKRLERGRFIWPSTEGGVVHLSGGQMSYLLEGIDWRNPQQSWRPTRAGYPFLFVFGAIFCFTLEHGYDSIIAMQSSVSPMPDDVEALKAALAAATMRADQAEAALLGARAERSDDQALIAHLKLQIEKLKHQLFGARSERSSRLLDQLELQLEELEATASQDEAMAQLAARKAAAATGFERRRPSRQPFPEHLPRERVVIPAPCACPACGGTRLSRIGEDVTETLEVIPRRWKVIQTVREKVACRDCEKISQPPAPFHVVARGWAGPGLLAMMLFEKFGQHQPLNRQVERYGREGVPLSLSTLADQVGAAAAALEPLHHRLAAHVMGAERLHGDDTTVPVLARGKAATGRIWTYVRDDRPFGGPAPPAALFYFSPNRAGEHPRQHLADWSGILQADAYGGYARLYDAGRQPGPVLEAGCWSHARRAFFALADIEASARRRAEGKTPAPISPLALEIVQRMDRLFEVERAINRHSAQERLAVRQERSSPMVDELEALMLKHRPGLSRHDDLAKAMDYMLKRWPVFTRFLHDGRMCLTNNAAERALRGIALGRKAWLFAGSDRGGQRCRKPGNSGGAKLALQLAMTQPTPYAQDIRAPCR